MYRLVVSEKRMLGTRVSGPGEGVGRVTELQNVLHNDRHCNVHA